MAGHSKWKNIQNRKGAQDAKKGKVFTRILKEIAVAVKTGGGDDPEANPRLRAAIGMAKTANLPKDTVLRAIKKASGAEDSAMEEITYEGYGPFGIAIFIECASDNSTRTVGNIRSYFNKAGGNLGKDGCLQFVFDRKGIFVIEAPADNVDKDEFVLQLIDFGAEDVQFLEDGTLMLTTLVEDFSATQKELLDRDIVILQQGLERIPQETKELDAISFEKILKLIDKIEDDEDVQNVYHNAIEN